MSGDIEFVQDDDTPDESSTAPAPDPRGTRRRAVLYRIAAGALVVGVVIVWLVTRPSSDDTPAAAPTATVTVAPSPLHATIECQYGASPDRGLLFAIRRAFPAFRVKDVYRCVRSRDGAERTVYETISGRVGRINLDVDSTLRGSDAYEVSPSSEIGSDGGELDLLARIEALAAGLRVDVSAYGRHGAIPPIDPMRSLADDISLNVVL